MWCRLVVPLVVVSLLLAGCQKRGAPPAAPAATLLLAPEDLRTVAQRAHARAR